MTRKNDSPPQPEADNKVDPFAGLDQYATEPKMGWPAYFEERQRDGSQRAWESVFAMTRKDRSIYSGDSLNDYYAMITSWLESIFAATFAHSAHNQAQYYRAFGENERVKGTPEYVSIGVILDRYLRAPKFLHDHEKLPTAIRLVEFLCRQHFVPQRERGELEQILVNGRGLHTLSDGIERLRSYLDATWNNRWEFWDAVAPPGKQLPEQLGTPDRPLEASKQVETPVQTRDRLTALVKASQAKGSDPALILQIVDDLQKAKSRGVGLKAVSVDWLSEHGEKLLKDFPWQPTKSGIREFLDTEWGIKIAAEKTIGTYFNTYIEGRRAKS